MYLAFETLEAGFRAYQVSMVSTSGLRTCCSYYLRFPENYVCSM